MSELTDEQKDRLASALKEAYDVLEEAKAAESDA